MNTTPLYIFDLDGTLADIAHRRRFVSLQNGSEVTVQGTKAIYRGPNPRIPGDLWIEYPGINSGLWSYDISDVKFKPNWDAFHAACVNDTPIYAVIDTLCNLRMSDCDIYIWSGRMITVLAETRQWLLKHVGLTNANELRMRGAGDYTPDDVLKESWFHGLSPEDRARLVMVFDDRDRVVNMWRRNGVVCAQVAPGDF